MSMFEVEPTGRRWMMFVDGENFTLRAQELRQAQGRVPFEAGRFWRPDVFVWSPRYYASGVPFDAPRVGEQPERWRTSGGLRREPVRAYYYVSATADAPGLTEISDQLWALGFTGRVFKKARKAEKAKAVDIAVSRDMLAHGFRDHYDIAFLVAGDGDYLPLVDEVKRDGKVVIVAFFASGGLNDDLRREADAFINLEAWLLDSWSGYLAERDG
jgi:hypothetical protein